MDAGAFAELPPLGHALDLTPDQRALLDNADAVLRPFDDAYWASCDTSGTFPDGFFGAAAQAGWFGIAMPEAYGGSALGICEAALLMERVAKAGGMTAASAIHINIFGAHPIVVHGSADQKQRWLPPLIQGDLRMCFGITEPDAGLDTTHISTRAERVDGGWRISGQKIWTSTAQHADRILLLARTTPAAACKRRSDRLTLFFAEIDPDRVEIREIAKMGRKAVDSNQVFIDALTVPDRDRVGPVDAGLPILFDGLNPERILIAMEAIGIGLDAVRRASLYARDRAVFGRPIGANQSVQHPLAESWMALQSARLMTLQAARLYDAGQSCGAEANAAKYLGSEAALTACERAVRTHGGMGYAAEFHVERLLREVMIPVLAPVSNQMILNYISERVLDLPRSY
ncbi:MAG: acyl-CoA dehydrogenase family protein [Pseudomonadota bacterium]